MSSEYHIELSILVSLPSWPVAALHEKYLWGDHDIQPNKIFYYIEFIHCGIGEHSDCILILRQVFCITVCP